MSTYREHIEELRSRWVGKDISYKGERHTIVDVDYNGSFLIDKPARFTDTTAIAIHHIDKVYEGDKS